MRSYIPRAVLAASAAGALALTACSSGGNPDEAAGENVEDRGDITFAMGSTDAETLKPLIDVWNDDHPDEQVKFQELPSEADDQRDKLVQSLQAGNDDYDVMALDVTWTAEFAANGWLEALDDDLQLDTAGLLPATVDSATYKDTLYAAPMNTNAQLMYYRTDILDDAPEMWADLPGACEQAEEEDVDCLITQLKNYEGLTVNALDFINSWGGAVVGPDGETPEIDSPEAKAGLQALVDGYEDGDIAESSTALNEDDTNQAFVDGNAALAYNWPYMYSNAESEEGDDDSPASEIIGDFDVAPILGEDGPGASVLGGYNNGINVFSKHKATALDFMEFIESEESQVAFAEDSFPPVLSSIYDDPELSEEFPFLPTLKEALENAEPRPVSPYYETISKGIRDNVYAALTEGKSVDDAVDDIVTVIEDANN